MREWAKPIPHTDYMAMRQAFAKKFGEPEDKEYIERKLQELETGEFRAESLNVVLSRDEIVPIHWFPSGIARALRSCSRSGPEQLRLRL